MPLFHARRGSPASGAGMQRASAGVPALGSAFQSISSHRWLATAFHLSAQEGICGLAGLLTQAGGQIAYVSQALWVQSLSVCK